MKIMIEEFAKPTDEQRRKLVQTLRRDLRDHGSFEASNNSVISCDRCGERIRGRSYFHDGNILCGLCLDDLNTLLPRLR
jgi:methionyl-tRNA synthetase